MLRIIPIQHTHIYTHMGAEVLLPAIIAEVTLSVIVVVEKAIVVVSFVKVVSCVMFLAMTGIFVVFKAPVESEKYNTGSSCRFEHLSVHCKCLG